jgi:hypothetical protein
MYDRDHGHGGVQVDMFGLFKNKEKEKLHYYYAINIDDIETFDQLREFVKIAMRSLGSTSGIAMIREDYLDDFPELAKIANKKG